MKNQETSALKLIEKDVSMHMEALEGLIPFSLSPVDHAEQLRHLVNRLARIFFVNEHDITCLVLDRQGHSLHEVTKDREGNRETQIPFKRTYSTVAEALWDRKAMIENQQTLNTASGAAMKTSKSTLTFPILVDDSPVGVIQIARQSFSLLQMGGFTREDIRVLSCISSAVLRLLQQIRSVRGVK